MSGYSSENSVYTIIDGRYESIASHTANDDNCQNCCNDLAALFLLRRPSRLCGGLSRCRCGVVNAACRLFLFALAKPETLLGRFVCFLLHQFLSHHCLASGRHLVRKVIGVRNIGNGCSRLGRLLNSTRYRYLIFRSLCRRDAMSRNAILHRGLRSLNSGLRCGRLHGLNNRLRLNTGNVGLRCGGLLYRGLSRNLCRTFLCKQCIDHLLFDLSNRAIRHDAGAVGIDIGRNFLAVDSNVDNANRLAQSRIRFHEQISPFGFWVVLCIKSKHLGNRVGNPVQQNIC